MQQIQEAPSLSVLSRKCHFPAEEAEREREREMITPPVCSVAYPGATIRRQ